MKVLASTRESRQPLAWRRFKTYDERAERLPRLWWQLLWEPRDLWFGAYWNRPDVDWQHALDVYVCVLPCLPVKFALRWRGWRLEPVADHP